MKNKRVLLLINIFRRDIGSVFVLSKLLEENGCKCFITGFFNYNRIDTKLWNPDVIVVLSVNRVLKLKKAYPKADIFYIPGEGGENYPNCEERVLAEEEEIFNGITKIFLWGKNAIENITKRIDEIGSDCFLDGKEDILLKKIKVVGQPRYDLVEFSNNNANNEKINIGFIGNFAAINSITGRTTLFKVLSEDSTIYQQVISQVNMGKLYCDVIKKLDNSIYNYSIRPYPGEYVNQYFDAEIINKYSVQIDESYDFGTWISKQDLIIGPTSSTYGLIAAMNKPLLLVDFVNNSRDESEYKMSMSKLFHQDIILPRTLEQLLKMIKDFRSMEIYGPKQDIILDQLYSIKMKGSVLARISNEIKSILDAKNRFSIRLHIPFFLLKFIDRFIFIFKENKNRYSSMCYSKSLKSLNHEFGPVVEKIQKSEKFL